MALMAYEKVFGAQESYGEKWKDDWDSELKTSNDGFSFKKDGFFSKKTDFKQFCLLVIKIDQPDSTEPILSKPDPIDRTRPKLTHSPH